MSFRRYAFFIGVCGLLCSPAACDKGADRDKPSAPEAQTQDPAIKTWSVSELQGLPAEATPTGPLRLLAWLNYAERACHASDQKDCVPPGCDVCTGKATASDQAPQAKRSSSLALLRKGAAITCKTRKEEWPKACPHPPGRYALSGRLVDKAGARAFEVAAFEDPDKPPAARTERKRIDPRKTYSLAVHAWGTRGDCRVDEECMIVSSSVDCDLADLAVPGRFLTGMPLKQLKFWRKMAREDREAGRASLDPRCEKTLLTAYRAVCEEGRCQAVPRE